MLPHIVQPCLKRLNLWPCFSRVPTSNPMKIRGRHANARLADRVPLGKASTGHDVERTRNEKAKEH